MNLRDVGSETSVNDTVQTNKMINKRLKCSTTTPIYIYSDTLINMEVVEYIYIYIALTATNVLKMIILIPRSESTTSILINLSP